MDPEILASQVIQGLEHQHTQVRMANRAQTDQLLRLVSAVSTLAEPHFPEPRKHPNNGSTLDSYSLHHMSIGVQTWGFHFLDPPRALGCNLKTGLGSEFPWLARDCPAPLVLFARWQPTAPASRSQPRARRVQDQDLGQGFSLLLEKRQQLPMAV